MKKFKNCFTICIDMDDTIENLLEAWLHFLNNKYNYNVNIEDITCWEIEKQFPELSSEQIFEPLFIEDFWTTVSPKLDAIYYIDKLIKEGQDVYICTSSHYATLKYKVDAILKKHFPFIDTNHIIVTANKQMVKCDIMIDDSYYNLISSDNYQCLKLLFDAPHNRSFDEDEYRIKRVYNWEDIYNLITAFDYFYYKYDIEPICY